MPTPLPLRRPSRFRPLAQRAARHSLPWLAAALLAPAAHAAPPACALKPADLAKQFGIAFAEGKVDDTGLGTGCKYSTQGGSRQKGTDFSVFLGVVPPQGSMEMMRKMIAGPGAKFEPVAGDPDKAATVRHAEPQADVMYERAGHLVVLRVMGSPGGTVAELNAKLLKLPRLP